MIPHPADQMTSKFQATNNAISLISTHAKRVIKHDSQLSLELQNQTTNNSNKLNNLKFAYPASQIPLNTSLAKQNTTLF